MLRINIFIGLVVQHFKKAQLNVCRAILANYCTAKRNSLVATYLGIKYYSLSTSLTRT